MGFRALHLIGRMNGVRVAAIGTNISLLIPCSSPLPHATSRLPSSGRTASRSRPAPPVTGIHSASFAAAPARMYRPKSWTTARTFLMPIRNVDSVRRKCGFLCLVMTKIGYLAKTAPRALIGAHRWRLRDSHPAPRATSRCGNPSHCAERSCPGAAP